MADQRKTMRPSVGQNPAGRLVEMVQQSRPLGAALFIRIANRRIKN